MRKINDENKHVKKASKEMEPVEKWSIIAGNAIEGKQLGKCPYCNEDTLKVSRCNLGEEINIAWMERYINTIWCKKCKRGVWSADSKSDLKIQNIPIPSDLTLEVHFDF